MDAIDETPDHAKQPNEPAKRRFVGMAFMLLGLGIFAYVVPDISAGMRERDAAADQITNYSRLKDEPSDADLKEYRYPRGGQDWHTYKAARTRVRIAGVLGVIAGMSLTGGISLFLRARQNRLTPGE